MIRPICAAMSLAGFLAACATPVNLVGDTVIRNVNVIPMTNEAVIENQMVIIRQGKIAGIRTDHGPVQIMANQIVDADGAYLVPGLSDMHVHLALKLPWDGDPSVDEMEDELGLFLANGVTTVRNMRASPGILELRDAIERGEIKGPELIASGRSLHSTMPEIFGPRITTAAEAVKVVEAEIADGYDLIKLHGDVPQEAFDSVIETAHAAGLQVAGHIQSDKPVETNARLDYIEHAEEIGKLLGAGKDFSDAPEILDALLNAGTAVTPTLVIFHSIPEYLTDDRIDALYAKPATSYVTRYWRQVMMPESNFFRQMFGDNYESRVAGLEMDAKRLRLITHQMHEAGIPLLLGTDSVGLVAPGFSVHEELELLVDAGLSPFEALQTATTNPARLSGREGTNGVVKIGAEADLVLLSGNPLNDISSTDSIVGVMNNGEWFDRAALDLLLQKRRENQR